MANVVSLFEENAESINEDAAFITFKNKGELDVRAIRTMGMSAKDNAKAIGYFGTGLKYAIAVLLRESQSITIYSGTDMFEFAVKEVEFRGQTFDVVTMNGEELGFTTDLGKNWKVWQAYRELHCNCTDEGGNVSVSYGDIKPEAGTTVVLCQGEEIEGAFNERGTIILSGTPRLKSEHVEVYEGEANEIFYRNIRALTIPKSLFTYNIQRAIELTEDRTIKYSWYARGYVMNAVLQSHDKAFIHDVLTAPQGSFEGTFDFTDTSVATATPSDEFLEVAGNLSAKAVGNASSRVVFRKHVSFEEKPTKPVQLTENQNQMFLKATEFCEKMGYDIGKYPVIVTHELGHDVLGLARDGKIFINIRAFQRGIRQLAATLIEEFIHLDKNLDDETRALQNYLFERMVDLGAELYHLEPNGE